MAAPDDHTQEDDGSDVLSDRRGTAGYASEGRRPGDKVAASTTTEIALLKQEVGVLKRRLDRFDEDNRAGFAKQEERSDDLDHAIDEMRKVGATRHDQNFESLGKIMIALGIDEGIKKYQATINAGVAARKEGRSLALIGAGAVLLASIVSVLMTLIAQRLLGR